MLSQKLHKDWIPDKTTKRKLYRYKYYNTSYQKEIACYWVLSKTRAFLCEWNTDVIINIKQHWSDILPEYEY